MYSTPGQIAKLAADGNRVAALTTHIAGSNDTIVVWQPPGSQVTQFVTGQNSAHPDGVIGYVSKLALGSGHIAWLEISGGNTVDDVMYTAPVGDGAAKQLADDANTSGAEGGIGGDYAGQLLGSDQLLFYNEWNVCDYEDSGDSPSPACPVEGTISRQQLVGITADGSKPVASGPNAFQLVAVGGGRLAFEPADTYGYSGGDQPHQVPTLGFKGGGTVRVTTAAAAPVSTVAAVAGDSPRAVALSETHLLVQRAHKIDSYNPATGEHVGDIQLGSASEQLEGVNADLALLSDGHQLILIRLSDGKRVTIPVSSALVDAKLNDTGLFYAYNVSSGHDKGRIAFDSAAGLLARF